MCKIIIEFPTLSRSFSSSAKWSSAFQSPLVVKLFAFRIKQCAGTLINFSNTIEALALCSATMSGLCERSVLFLCLTTQKSSSLPLNSGRLLWPEMTAKISDDRWIEIIAGETEYTEPVDNNEESSTDLEPSSFSMFFKSLQVDVAVHSLDLPTSYMNARMLAKVVPMPTSF